MSFERVYFLNGHEREGDETVRSEKVSVQHSCNFREYGSLSRLGSENISTRSNEQTT